jgi:putative glycosyltransferase (TIGR04372 family)
MHFSDLERFKGMIFKSAHQILKSRLKQYPIAYQAYRRLSWILTRSSLAWKAKRFFPTIANACFPIWIGPRLRLAHYLATNGQVSKAIAIADDIMARNPDYNDVRLYLVGSIYSLQGRYEHANELFERMENNRYERARELQYDRLSLRFFSNIHFSQIGHLGVLDRYIKAEALGIIPKRTNVLLGPSKRFSNPAYVQCWENYFVRIDEPGTMSELRPIIYPLEEVPIIVRVDQGIRSITALARETQLRWETENRKPLLELSAEHKDRGYQRLREFGLPKECWFAGLHVREGNDLMRDVRNSDISTYHLAIQEIGNRGGWVLRMGDPSMSRLPPFANAIDYAHSGRREDWMDVFIWGEGRFFIGTGSGPQMVPTTFGKPVAIANYGPIPTIACCKHDILLPKHYFSEREGRYLTLTERTTAQYGFRESTGAFASMGIHVLDNTPEELRTLVVEMMDRLDGSYTENEQQRAAQASFNALAAEHQFYPATLARAFAARYPGPF